jgi:hypothetical protein
VTKVCQEKNGSCTAVFILTYQSVFASFVTFPINLTYVEHIMELGVNIIGRDVLL